MTLKPTEDGFYWLLVDAAEPTVGRWTNAHGWMLIGDMLNYDPDDPVDLDVLGKFTLGPRIKPPPS